MNITCNIAQKLWTYCTKDWETARICILHRSIKNMYEHPLKSQNWIKYFGKPTSNCTNYIMQYIYIYIYYVYVYIERLGAIFIFWSCVQFSTAQASGQKNFSASWNVNEIPSNRPKQKSNSIRSLKSKLTK